MTNREEWEVEVDDEEAAHLTTKNKSRLLVY
jgi:hypothetical protein